MSVLVFLCIVETESGSVEIFCQEPTRFPTETLTVKFQRKLPLADKHEVTNKKQVLVISLKKVFHFYLFILYIVRKCCGHEYRALSLKGLGLRLADVAHVGSRLTRFERCQGSIGFWQRQ